MYPSSERCGAVYLLLKFLFLANDIIQTVHTKGPQTCLHIRITWGDF